MWRTRSLLQFPDRTNGSLSLSFYLFLVAIVYLFLSLHFFSFFFHSMRELFSFIFFPRGLREGEGWRREGERSEFRNGCISRPLTMRELIYRARANRVFDAVFFSSLFFSSFFFCVCLCVHTLQLKRKRRRRRWDSWCLFLR